MKPLLQQLQESLNTAFETYDDSKDIPSVHNAECIAHLKHMLHDTISAFTLIKTLPDEIDKLDTKLWSFLPFVDDPIRDLKENLQKVLNLKKYEIANVLQVESTELRYENAELNKRLVALEKIIEVQRSTKPALQNTLINCHPDVIQSAEELEAQIRTEVEQEVKTEVELLRQQNQRLQEEAKRLTLKCEAFKKQVAGVVLTREQVEQQLTITQNELATTKDSLANALAEIMRLAEENRMLRQRLNPEQNKKPKDSENMVELVEPQQFRT